MKDNVTFNIGGLDVSVPIEDILRDHNDRRFTTFYPKNASSLLNGLCDKYGSDKGEIQESGHPYPWPSHSYADFAERLFGHCRQHIRFVFECGIGTNNPDLVSSMGIHGRPGASLRVWRDYFPMARIVGADVDKDILFEEERITTYYCDQTKPDVIKALWEQMDVDQFDLMIDDGLHTFDAGVCLLENSFHKLRNGGIYIIEDVGKATLFQFQKYLKNKSYNYEFVTLHRKNVPLLDNSLIILRK
jgi:hypothetical protein